MDDQQCVYPKSNYGGNKPFKKDNYFRQSFAGLEAARADEDQDQDFYYEDEPPAAAISDLFDGFLAIGTLGANPNVPSTPTFGTSVDNITEKATEVTENELKLINDELEKVLVAETNKEDGYNYDSSARNSHVSNGRSSHGSSITLGGKSTDCPLQGYLFGSAIEMSETTTTTAVPKKENRTSLGELFQKTKVMEDPKEEKRILENNYKEGGTGDKSAAHSIMKKMLKKKMLHPSAETKLHKVRHIYGFFFFLLYHYNIILRQLLASNTIRIFTTKCLLLFFYKKFGMFQDINILIMRRLLYTFLVFKIYNDKNVVRDIRTINRIKHLFCDLYESWPTINLSY